METFETWRRVGAIALLLLVLDLMIWNTVRRGVWQGKNTELYFLDVGQGDSSLISLPGSVQILIDGGPPNQKVLTELRESLGRADRYIDLVVMTHPQLDHYGGLIDVLNEYEVGAFVATGRIGETSSYQSLRDAIEAHGVPYITVRAGDRITIGSAQIAVLGPTPEEFSSKELNDTCVVLRLESEGLTALYTGDIGPLVEERLSKQKGIKSLILKVAHHGSRFSSTQDFLNAVSSRVAVVEVGKNTYGHPTAAALGRLEKSGDTVFRTDRNGTVRVDLRGSELEVHKEKAGVIDKK